MRRSLGFQRALDAARGQNLDNQLTTRYAPSGRGVRFDLSFLTSGPRVGPSFSGDLSQYIRYVRNQNVVSLWFTIPMTLCTSFGTNGWGFTLPGTVSNLTTAGQLTLCRGGWEAIRDWNNTKSSYASGFVELIKPSQSGFNPNGGTAYALLAYLPANPGPVSYITASAPWAWATTDLLTGFITYEAADQYTP